jgi:hypothetical protein
MREGTLRIDSQGKALGQALLEMKVEVDAAAILGHGREGQP